MRLFFALWPDPAARDVLAELAGQAAREAGGHATATEKLHVTVVFLGTIDAMQVARLADIAGEAAGRVDAFDLALERVGGTASGIAWITPLAVPPALLDLHARLHQGLQAGGFRVEARAFRPHVTLARNCIRRPGRHTTGTVRWRADAVSLVASQPQRGGARYRDLAAWPLGGA